MPKINISAVKKAGISGIVGDLISAQNNQMDLDDFLRNVKVWEQMLKRERSQ